MKLTVESHPERIKRYSHIQPAPRWGGTRCSVRCPGTTRSCTLKKRHSGPHVAHGLFGRVVAVWEPEAIKGTPSVNIRRAQDSRSPRDSMESLPGAAFRALRDWGKTLSVEEVALLILALAMAGFAVDWALRIMGVK